MFNDWFTRYLVRHEHNFGQWELKEKREVLVGHLGKTEHTEFWNIRTCRTCNFTEMKKAVVK